MPSYAFAIGNVRMHLRIGPKTRTNRRFSKTRPDARTKAKKEDMSGETRTYDNARGRRSTALSSKRMQCHVNSQCNGAEQTRADLLMMCFVMYNNNFRFALTGVTAEVIKH